MLVKRIKIEASETASRKELGIVGIPNMFPAPAFKTKYQLVRTSQLFANRTGAKLRFTFGLAAKWKGANRNESAFFETRMFRPSNLQASSVEKH